jgi:hypothetical protein
LESGSEFWRRYPEDYRRICNFRATASLSDLHKEKLPIDFFPVVGSVPKTFSTRNQKRKDMSVVLFEDETDKTVDRSQYGLPVPNIQASYRSLAKYAKKQPALDESQVQCLTTAFDWLEKQFGPHMQNSRVKTLKEVVAGLDMSTSPGFPWNKKYATKKELIDNWEGFELYMEEDWQLLATDVRYTAVFGNSLKEEIRTVEKIKSNSIRTFTAGPIEMTIHGNRLFEDMNEKFIASHLQTASVVGFTPLKGGWNQLYNKLHRFKRGFALDESEYDSSLRAHIMWACANFRWNMLRKEDKTEENYARLVTYYRNLVNTLIITAEGVFVMKQGGNPSGSVNTISDNTLILYILISYAWLRTAPAGMRNYQSFNEKLELALCGDDNTWTIDEKAMEFFNARSVIAQWGPIGITTTTDSLEPRMLEELDFLSATTVFVDGIAIPHYNSDKLLTSLLYSKKPNDPSMTLVRACALLRVGWADEALTTYLKELVGWLVLRYGKVMTGDPEWKIAMSQIPTEQELRDLFLGRREKMFEQQSLCGIKRKMSKPHKKVELNSMQVALPQRQRRNRVFVPKKQVVVAQNQVKKPKRQRRQRAQAPRRKINRRRRQGRGQGGPGGSLQWPSGNKPRSRRWCPVEEDEYIGDINGTTGFGTTAYAVNPGQAATFPWLSKQAAQWEKYRFEYLEFYYKPEVSQFATNGQSGKVILSADYDASDAPPPDKQHAEDSDPHTDCMPYQSLRLKLDPYEMHKNSDAKYVRPGALPGGSDIKTYDCANLFISTYGNAATSVVGELHVRYRVLFEVPVLDSTTTAPSNNQVALFYDATGQSYTTATAATAPVATVLANGLLAVNTAGNILLPAGNYLVDWTFLGTSTGALTLVEAALIGAGTTFESIQAVGSAAAATNLTVSGSSYISVNGSTSIHLVAEVSGSGTLTGQASFRITAV